MSTPTAQILYDGKRLIPAPQVSFNRNYRRKDSQQIVGSDLTCTLNGSLVACRGWDFTSGVDFHTGSGDYPSNDSDCCKFDNLLNMQEKLREHFAVDRDYKDFVVQQIGYAPKSWKARVSSLDFGEGRWIDYVPYSITLSLQEEYTSIVGGVSGTYDDNIVNFDESWGIEFKEDQGEVYSLTHSLTCQAKDYHSATGLIEGWKKAKEWVDGRVALSDYTGAAPVEIKNDLIFASDGFDLNTYSAYNYEKDQAIDELNGGFTINERWELAEDPVFREVSINVNRTDFDEDTVTIEGYYIGMLDTSGSNPNAARTAFDSWISSTGHYTIANEYYGYAGGAGTLNSSPISSSIRYIDQIRGTGDIVSKATRKVGFSYEFSCTDFCNSDVFKEDIVITHQNSADVFAVVPILGRAAGPIIQDKGTVTPKRTTINIEWQYPKSTGDCYLVQPTGAETAVQSVVSAANVCSDSTGNYLESDTESWNPRKGRYSRSLTYICEEC